ncbi:MAG: hypothetical protein EOO89_30405 [Pedobacter sp.]|nr:MAG: hypothetical protein EOO89_30405 [Pedobacter sp.]
MADINIKSVRYPLLTDQKFEKIALKLGRTKQQVFIQMVDYFYKSKKDPKDMNDELLKNTLLKNHQQYIGFIKTQENMLLVPMKTLMDRIGESQRQIIDFFNKEVMEHNITVLNTQNTHTGAFHEVGRILEAMVKGQETKDTLKTKFLFILENYIRSREAIKMMSINKDKEEIIKATKEQVRLL